MIEDASISFSTCCWEYARDTKGSRPDAHRELGIDQTMELSRQNKILLTECQTVIIISQYKKIGVWSALGHQPGRRSVHVELADAFLEQKEGNIEVRHFILIYYEC